MMRETSPEKTAIVLGLLPPSDQVSELEKRDYFLKQLSPAVIRQFNNSVNTSRSDIGVTFSHVNISPSIDFDAVMFDVEMDPKILATAPVRGKGPRHTVVIQATIPEVESDCGPWPALCLVKKRLYQPSDRAFAFDPLQQVRVFSSCATEYGENLMSFGSRPYYTSVRSPFAPFACGRSSNTSFMVMSIGKRLVADALERGKSDNVTMRTGDPALITNLRKIYTLTIGRVSWRLQDLDKTFGADCGAELNKPNCTGLHFPLEPTTMSEYGSGASASKKQRLVVSADGLRTDLIYPSTNDPNIGFMFRSIPLVEVTEPTPKTTLGGDILLPHNINHTVWKHDGPPTELGGGACDADIEAVLFNNLNNHAYIEHGFQTAYTSATFFLFQDAVVKDEIPAGPDSPSNTTLNFAGNTQGVVATVSTPLQNALLTLVGCGIIVISALSVVGMTIFSTQETDPLASITAPQAIARVIMDGQQFPEMLLHRRVVDQRGEELQHRRLDEFLISQLAVEHSNEGRDRDVYLGTR